MPRWVKFIAILLFALVLAIAALPWWIGPAAAPLLRRQGITLIHPKAEGFRTLGLEQVRVVRGNTTVIVRDVRIPSPLLWLRPAQREASAGAWSVVVAPSTAPAPSKTGGIDGMPALHNQLRKIAGVLQRWLPRAYTGAGEVRWPGGNLTLVGASWRNAILTGRSVKYLGQIFDLTIDAAAADYLQITARHPAADASASLRWGAAEISGLATFWDQPAQIQATFPTTGWLPQTASVRAENWTLPAERARLGAHYRQLTGRAELTWRDGGFAASLQAQAAPKPGASAPPFKARVEASGDLQAVRISALEVNAPFARTTLDAPLTVAWRHPSTGAPARLALELDLAKQPWVEAAGRITGSVSVAPDGRQEFSLTLENGRFVDVPVPHATAHGTWDGQRLAMSPLEVQIDATTHARLAGTLDWDKRELEGVRLEVAASPTALARWLPAKASWKQALITAQASGALSAPRHDGQIQLTGAQAGPLKPFDLTGRWRGTGTAVDEFSAEMAAENSRLQLTGRADPGGLWLEKLVFSPAGVEQLALTEPARLEWSPALRVTGLRLHGPAAALALDATAGANGSFHLVGAQLDKEWIHDWLDLPGPTWRVHQIDLSGQMNGPSLDSTAALAGEIHLPGRDVAQVTLAANGNRDGVMLTELKIAEAGAILTQVSGRAAVTWTPDGSAHWHIKPDAPLQLQADVLPDSPLWATLGEPAGVKLAGASARAQLTGTLAQPRGELRISIGNLQVASNSPRRARLPDVTGLVLLASGDRTQVRIDSFNASVEGQAVRGWARLPMAAAQWRQLVTNPAKFNWLAVEGKVEIPGAELEPLARRLPSFVAARGTLQAEVALSDGGKLSGALRIRGAATRPLPALGVLQEITAELRFSGRTAHIESFAGQLGGEPVQLRGTVELPPDGPPRPDLRLTGKNLPLVRRAGLLVRSDLDLQAKSTGNRTLVSGTVTLRDCLVLTEFSDLLPTGVRGVRHQPPYFSVAAEPFDHWGLAVELRGLSAVRMRTPFFTGVASAYFTLGGNLGEPRAVGEITVDEGRVFFPFATFTVQNGAVRLRAADPFHPELVLNATSRRHNYELRLEGSGSPEAPVLEFSSNPPLDSGQVLLMVMAGQAPANETTGTPGQGGLQLTQLGAYLGQGLYRGLGGSNESRLEIVSGEQVSRQGRETYAFEYKLNDRWSLVGEYDEFDSYNAGLKWRVYNQGGPGEKK
jgi:translocation and assembly module TamB